MNAVQPTQDDMMTSSFGNQLPELIVQSDSAMPGMTHTSSLPEAVLRIPVIVQVVIGSARLSLSQVTKLTPGTTLTLEEKLGTAARILVNGREVARGNLFVVDETDGRLGIATTEVANSAVTL